MNRITEAITALERAQQWAEVAHREHFHNAASLSDWLDSLALAQARALSAVTILAGIQTDVTRAQLQTMKDEDN